MRWGMSHRLAPTCTRRVPVCPRAGFGRDRSGSLTTGESGFRTPLDPDQEPVGEEPPTTAEAFAEPPF